MKWHEATKMEQRQARDLHTRAIACGVVTSATQCLANRGAVLAEIMAAERVSAPNTSRGSYVTAKNATVHIQRDVVAGQPIYRVETLVGGFPQPEYCKSFAREASAVDFQTGVVQVFDPQVPDTIAELVPAPVPSNHTREGLTPTSGGQLIVDCTVCGQIGTITAGPAEYERAEALFAAHHGASLTAPVPAAPVLRTGHVAALANLRFAGWTVKAIAAELKVSTRSVYKWLAGSNPSVARREALTALNYTLRSTGAGCGCGGVGYIHTGESWAGGTLTPTYVRCSCNK